MKIHEYQAKAILARHGVPVPRGEVAFTAGEAGGIARRLGGRSSSSRRRFTPVVAARAAASSWRSRRSEAETLARDMIGMTLVTHQTGPEGRLVSRVLIEEGLQMTRELYLEPRCSTAPRGKPVMMASAAGGMDIEEVAEKTPEKIVRSTSNPASAWCRSRRGSSGSRSASTRRRSTSS